MNFIGERLAAFDLGMQRIWDYTAGSNPALRQPLLKKDVLNAILGARTAVMIRIPFNYVPLENQLEMVIDHLVARGFRLIQVTSSQYGLYQQTWYFG